MLNFLIALVLASAPHKTYEIRATRNGQAFESQSCGAVPRMLKDKHTLRIYEDKVTVNGMEWRIASPLPDLAITFHDEPGQLTSLVMSLYVNEEGLSGKYYIIGTLENRTPCFDVVYVEGVRK